MIVVIALIVALAVTLILTFGRFARSDGWRATVTPLASIIGSGFLICGPLLAREFGSAALPAMAALLAIAYLAGSVIRFNIVHVEDHLAQAEFHDPIAWTARVTQGILAPAYAVSVAYYLKLLAEFALKLIAVDPAWQPLAANIIVTVIIALMTLLALGGSLRRVEHVAHGTVSIKIGIIAGLLVALAIAWATTGIVDPLPPARVSWASIPMLLGLIITVQGFETSRYLGHDYPAELRIRTMRHAQRRSASDRLLRYCSSGGAACLFLRSARYRIAGPAAAPMRPAWASRPWPSRKRIASSFGAATVPGMTAMKRRPSILARLASHTVVMPDNGRSCRCTVAEHV